MAADLTALSVSAFLFRSVADRVSVGLWALSGLASLEALLLPGVLGLSLSGAYRQGQAWLSFWRLAKAGLVAGSILAWPLLWSLDPAAGIFLLVFTWLATVLGCGVARASVWAGMDLFRGRRLDSEGVVILSDANDERALDRIRRIRRDPGFKVLDVIEAGSGTSDRSQDVKESLWSEVGDFAPDTLIIVGHVDQEWFEGAVELSVLTGLRLLSMPRYEGVGILRERIVWRNDGSSFLELTSPALKGGQLVIKRVIDVMGSGLGLLLFFPLFFLVGLAICLDSPGPVFFRQSRVGKGGRRFSILKFRTMSLDADRVKGELHHLNSTGDPRFFKIPDDPRVTRIGASLRRWSLDELPQLWNVLMGDMSLVGPRPFPVSDLRDYLDHHFDRLAVRPGITGLWQVGGRSRITSFEEVVRLDREYIDRWTLGLDLAILLRTIPAVFSGRGAQ